MFSRLRENFHLKILALIIATIMHFYVSWQMNPHQSRPFTIQVSTVNVPPGLLIDEKSLPTVTVTVDGPTDEVNRLTDSSVNALVDLSNGRLGRNSGERIHVELPSDVKADVTTDSQPRQVTVFLKPQTKRSLPVTASYPGTPPTGYAYRLPIVTPLEATIAGDDDTVNSVRQLVVRVDGPGPAGTVDDDFTIVPLDADGNEVNNLEIKPSMAHVRIGIIKAPVMRSLIVSPTVIGSLPFPYKIADVKATPSSVDVSGKTDILANIGTINTVPLDVSGATSDVTRDVALAPPDGIFVSKPVTVSVTVHIVTEQPGGSPLSVPARAAKP